MRRAIVDTCYTHSNAPHARNCLGRGRRLKLESLEPRHMLAAANLVITEFMASNGSTLLDGDGAFSDWIEIKNDGLTSVDLSDDFLPTRPAIFERWAFPARSIAPGAYFVVFASAPLDADGIAIDDYVDAGGHLHTNFGLGAEGEFLAITYEDPVAHSISIVHNFAPSFPAQRGDISYGLGPGGALRYFDPPTPGAANGAGFVDFVADTQFSVERGFFQSAFNLSISSTTPGAAIYYTTNGEAPTQFNGALYSGPFQIGHTSVVRAIAYQSGYLPSLVGTQTYLFLNDIVRQNTQATLDAGFPNTWGGTSPDYGLDPDVIGNFDANGNPTGGDKFGGIYATTIKNDLKSIPTLSISIDADDLFGPAGIYTNSTQRGDEWTCRFGRMDY